MSFCILAQTTVRLIQVLSDQNQHVLADTETPSRKVGLLAFETYQYRTYSSQSKEPPGSNPPNSGGRNKKNTPSGSNKGAPFGDRKGSAGGKKRGTELQCSECGHPLVEIDCVPRKFVRIFLSLVVYRIVFDKTVNLNTKP